MGIGRKSRSRSTTVLRIGRAMYMGVWLMQCPALNGSHSLATGLQGKSKASMMPIMYPQVINMVV